MIQNTAHMCIVLGFWPMQKIDVASSEADIRELAHMCDTHSHMSKG